MMLWLEMEGKGESKFSSEVKLIGGEFAVYAETVSDRNHHSTQCWSYMYDSTLCTVGCGLAAQDTIQIQKMTLCIPNLL